MPEPAEQARTHRELMLTKSCPACASRASQSFPLHAAHAAPINPKLLSTIAPAEAPRTNRVSIVDVMAVYTPAARKGAGGAEAMHTLIDLAMAEANTVYQNSRVDVRLRLVHRAEVAYEEANRHATNLARLQEKGDEFLEEVHPLRETNRADLVCLFTEHSDPGFGGLAFTMAEPTFFFRERAFSVVARAEAVGSYIFVHEISHNLGAQHDRQNALDAKGDLKSGSFPFSFGHRFTAEDKLYRTVMAYAPGTPIPYLSNPDVLFRGVPTGLPGTTNGANNALTINSNAVTVSAFHGPAVKTSPPLITITEPNPILEYRAGTNLVLIARATDLDGTVQHVAFYNANTLLGATSTFVSPQQTNLFSFTWTNAPAGQHRLTARAVDDQGASSAALPVQVIIRPRNDLFENRISIFGVNPSVDGLNLAGTVELGEAQHGRNPGGQSVWYAWEAPKSGTVTVTVRGQGQLPLTEIYKSLSSTSLVSVTRDFSFEAEVFLARAVFDAIAGVTYSIAVDSLGSAGLFTLSLDYQPAPENDDFVNRLKIEGETIRLTGENSTATGEAAEPQHTGNPGGKSIWYAWRAPKAGSVIVSVTATNFFPLADVYLGTSVTGLTQVAGRQVQFDSAIRQVTLSFDAQAGTEYALAVDGSLAGSGVFQLDLSYPRPPPNDYFIHRIPLLGTEIRFDSSNLYASTETGEPNHAAQAPSRSVWYAWTAPVSGPVTVTARSDGFFAVPDVYTGASVEALTNVVRRSVVFDTTNLVSTLTFTAKAFQSYALAIGGFQGGSGKFSFHLKTDNLPPSLELLSAAPPSRLQFRLRLFGSPQQSFVVQASTNLLVWTDIFIDAFQTNSFLFTDDNSHRFPYRYYRVLPLP